MCMCAYLLTNNSQQLNSYETEINLLSIKTTHSPFLNLLIKENTHPSWTDLQRCTHQLAWNDQIVSLRINDNLAVK